MTAMYISIHHFFYLFRTTFYCRLKEGISVWPDDLLMLWRSVSVLLLKYWWNLHWCFLFFPEGQRYYNILSKMKIKAFKESKCRKKMFNSIWSIRIIWKVMKSGIGYFDNLKIIYIKNFFFWWNKFWPIMI